MTPSWRLPAAALDARECLHARALFCAICFSLSAAAALALPVGTPVLVPVTVLLILDLARTHRQLAGRRFLFDGSGWWLHHSDGSRRPLKPAGSAYCSPLLLCLRLNDGDSDRDILLWRHQFSREAWRRLLLAGRYAVPSGERTVSTALGESSG